MYECDHWGLLGQPIPTIRLHGERQVGVLLGEPNRVSFLQKAYQVPGFVVFVVGSLPGAFLYVIRVKHGFTKQIVLTA